MRERLDRDLVEFVELEEERRREVEVVKRQMKVLGAVYNNSLFFLI